MISCRIGQSVGKSVSTFFIMGLRAWNLVPRPQSLGRRAWDKGGGVGLGLGLGLGIDRQK